MSSSVKLQVAMAKRDEKADGTLSVWNWHIPWANLTTHRWEQTQQMPEAWVWNKMSLLLYLEPNLFEGGNGLLILDMHHSNSFLLDIFPMSLECWKQLFCSVGHIIIPKHLPYELPLPSSTRKWIRRRPGKKKGRKGPLIWRGWICSFFFFPSLFCLANKEI